MSSEPSGAAVVLLHGWGGSYATTWRGSALERALRAAGRPVLEIDLPGHGRRPVSHDPADYEFIADLSGARTWPRRLTSCFRPPRTR